MSVPVNQRSQGKLDVCVKAHDLACYTLRITANKKIFKEEFRRSLTDKIDGIALDIWTKVWTANDILVRDEEDLKERNGLQREAIRECNVLLSLIEVAARLFHLTSKRVKYWTEKTVEVRNKIRAWRESDRTRYMAKLKQG